MKRFLFCLMAVLAFVGCTDEGPDDGGSTGGGSTQPQTTITLTTTALNFTTEGGSQNVTFTSSGDWTAQVLNDRANDWCKLTPASGAAGNGQITVTAAANATTDERSASIVLKSGTVQKTIKVTQKQKDALTITASKFEVAAEGGTVAIEVKANIDFSYAVDGASQSWIKYQTTRAMKTSTLVFDIAENDSHDKRQGTVTISSGALKEVVTIYQEGAKPAIVISKSEYVIGSEGGSVAVEVKSNVDVSVELPSDVEWLSESTTRAMSTNTYYFDVAENTGYDQRSATIVFTNKADNLTEEVTITQTQKDAIVLAKDNYVVDSEGDVIVIEVGHNVDFDVEIADSWITQDQTRTFVNDVLTFTVAKNTSYDNRESTIKFTSKDKSITQTAKVYQAQSDALIVSKKDIVIGDEGGTIDLVIQSNVEFTVSDPNVSWVHSVATRALTTTTLQYEVDANTSYDQRVATLIVTNTKTKATEEVTITQTQKDAIVLAKSEYEIGVDGGALDFEIQTNVDVTVKTSATWIKQVTTRALESKMLFFDIAANSAEEDREGTITLSGGDVTQTVTIKQKGTSEILEMERQALIALYNATDGDNWKNNTNWCSDKPVSEWKGVTCSSNGRITRIELSSNNLSGSIPPELGNLSKLEILDLASNSLSGSIPPELGNLSELIWIFLDSNQLSGSIPPELGNLSNLESMSFINNQLSGSIPPELGNLSNLGSLFLYKNQLSGSIPPELGNLSNLGALSLYQNQLSGSIPPELGNLSNLRSLYLSKNQLSGSIPPELGNLPKLTILDLGANQLTGSVPAELTQLPSLTRLYLGNNKLTGPIPSGIVNLANLTKLSLCWNYLTGELPSGIDKMNIWAEMWPNIIEQYEDNGNTLSIEGVTIPAPEFSVTTIDGAAITDAIYAENEYTILFNFADWCGYSRAFTPILLDIYNKYKDKGVEVLCYSSDTSVSEADLVSYRDEYELPWHCFLCRSSNKTLYNISLNIISYYSSLVGFPQINVVDKEGNIVFNRSTDSRYDLEDFLADKFGEDEAYESTDYSQDGVVTTLQTATKGAGIDLVLMGDAYSDRLIADGTYDKTMNTAMEKFFAVEPYKSYRDHFNVYSVKAVSKNEGYGDGYQTIFSGEFGEGTHVGGDHSKVIEYGLKAISDERMNEAMLVVMMNSSAYAGTCYMYHPSATGDAGSGLSISYFPIGVDDTALEQVLNHETNGHGFAKLADEYAYEANGVIPYESVTSTQTQQTDWGWWKNVDFVSDVTAVRWAKFISDSRFANEKLGAYEGAMTYWSGVWRPTENSIMRYNTGGFNAPSREAIYYRIHKLAYGDEWTYDYETFVKYDEINRTITTTTQSVPMIYKPTAPPVVIKKNWRDELR